MTLPASLSWRTLCALVAAGSCLAGCDNALRAPDPTDPDAADQALTISYDQVMTSYTRQWPGGTVDGPQNRGAGDSEYMLDYERVSEQVSYDSDGYPTIETRFLEGNQDMNMPEALYNEVQADMPAKPADYNPVVRTTIVGDTYTEYGASGGAISSTRIDREQLRRMPADSSVTGGTPGARVEANLQRLRDAGTSPEMISDHHAAIRRGPSGSDAAEGVSGYRYVFDLDTGLPTRTVVLNQQGQPRFVELRTYEKIDGEPVPVHTERYVYGMVDGTWSVAGRTIEHRTNVTVHRGR